MLSWNAEGVRGKASELGRWLSDNKVDVAAIQEAQLAGDTLSVPGYQTAAVSRRARGRRDEGPIRGGDVVTLVRNGLNFTVIRDSPLQPRDDTTECCAVRIILSAASHQPRRYLDIFNVYRPTIRSSASDERVDFFFMDGFPTTDSTLILEDFNGHHPDWDVSCLNPDRVGRLVHDWADREGWQILNSGAATRAGYGEGARLTTPDVSLAHSNLARRCLWSTGTDLGSDHLPQLVAVSTSGHRPRHIRKTHWAFHKADWTGFTARCEASLAALARQELPVEKFAAQLNDAIIEASVRHIPRGARADPKPWALDPELDQAAAERREARDAMHRDPTQANRSRWKEKKKQAADVEAAARHRAFREFASTELNRPAALGRVTKILRRMEGAVADACPGQAVNGDRGQLVAEDRDKAEAFARTYALVSCHTRLRRRDRTRRHQGGAKEGEEATMRVL